MKVLRIILFLLLPVFAKAQDSAYQAYIETFSPLAIAEQLRTGVPASIKLAQGLLESGAGNGELCQRSNNHFGIKCKNTWTGDKVYHNDDARGECFRAYLSAEESYRDHSNFLRANARYAPLFALDVFDYKAWAEGLKKAGYATNPKYVAMLIKVVEENNLNEFTTIALNGPTTTPTIATEVVNNAELMIAETPSPAVPVIVPVAAVSPKQVVPQISMAKDYPAGYFTINESKVCFAPAGTSILALAMENNLTVAAILQFNDMNAIDILPADQLIFVERKKKKGTITVVELKSSCSLWSVSQEQGVRLGQLAVWNNLPTNAQLQKGTKIYLQNTAPSSAATASK